MKRIFDLFFSIIFIALLSPLFIFFSLLIVLDSPGCIFYRQLRVGRGGKEFYLIKFRTMKPGADRSGLLTVGSKDHRITRFGYFLRKYKLDELPQLFNIICGDMSIVGPRPEVSKYVALYNEEQRQVLSVLPGLTDYASLQYINESDLLSQSTDPEALYMNEIMPAKLKLNLQYIRERNLGTDVKIIFKTIKRIIF